MSHTYERPPEHLTIHDQAGEDYSYTLDEASRSIQEYEDLETAYSLPDASEAPAVAAAVQLDTSAYLDANDPSDQKFADGLQAMAQEGGETLNLAEFEASAIEPDSYGEFPIAPEKSYDIEGDNNRILNWHLSRCGVGLDEAKQNIDTDEAAKEWLKLKLLVAGLKKTTFEPSKWDAVNDLEEDVIKPFVAAYGGSTHWGE